MTSPDGRSDETNPGTPAIAAGGPPKALQLSGLVMVCGLVLIGSGLVYQRTAPRATFEETTSQVSTGLPGIPVGQPFDLGLIERNASHSSDLVLREATFPNGVPAGVRIERQAASKLIHGYFNAYRGWPPKGFPGWHPISGYRVRSRHNVFVAIELVAHSPGVYDIGPVTLHAGHQGPIWLLPFGSSSTSYTDHTTASFCVAVTKQVCDRHWRRIGIIS